MKIAFVYDTVYPWVKRRVEKRRANSKRFKFLKD